LACAAALRREAKRLAHRAVENSEAEADGDEEEEEEADDDEEEEEETEGCPAWGALRGTDAGVCGAAACEAMADALDGWLLQVVGEVFVGKGG
jgi:hypothetical protein